jgi:hypothetical protein
MFNTIRIFLVALLVSLAVPATANALVILGHSPSPIVKAEGSREGPSTPPAEPPAASAPETAQPSPPQSTPPAEGPSTTTTTTTTVVVVQVTPTTQTQPGDVEKAQTSAARKLTELAQEYWGYEPVCPGGYHVYVNNITDQPNNPDGTGTNAAGEAEVPGCSMRIIPSYWEETLSPGAQTEDTCAVFIHEYGHSLGHPHTTNPNSVMNPFTMYEQGMPQECKELAAPVEATAHVSKVRKHKAKKHHRKVRKQRIKKIGAPDATGAAPFALALDPFTLGLVS